MNEPQTNTPVPDDLSDQVASLRRQITHLLLLLIVVSGTLSTFLFYQAHTFGNDLTVVEPQARVVIQNYNKNLPNLQKFVQDLVAYGQAHPDFQPILKKYGISPTPVAATHSAPKP